MEELLLVSLGFISETFVVGTVVGIKVGVGIH